MNTTTIAPPADHTESPAYVAALAAFRASVTIMSVQGFANEYGVDILEGIEGVDSVMVYDRGTWIANMGNAFNRHHYLILERDEYSTADGSYTLGQLEALLFDWVQADEAFGAAKEEPHAAADAAANAALSRFSDTWDRIDAKHAVARALMATRPDLPMLSLDEWLNEHHARLTAKERAAARAILDLLN